jgi:alanyl-tRNA synthetase
MTERLYYADAYLRGFEATLLDHDVAGQRLYLDQTAFYPTSGGQPFDRGVLHAGASELAVVDVVDEGERIAHVLAEPQPALPLGTRLSGTIDWARRFDHMQQHTGQHVLSAAFDRLFSNRTESFHLGSDSCTIDLAREASASEVAASVAEANRIVWEDRPVDVRFVTAEEAATLPLRKEPARGGRLRLVEVKGFDLSACGGTHVARTGGIGIIAVSGWEKFRGGARIHFLCGARTLRRFDLWRDALSATQRHLSVAPEELASAVERLQGDNKSLQRTLRTAQDKLAVHEASALVARGERVGSRLVVVEAVPDLDAGALKAMAAAAAAEPGAAVVLFGAASPALVVVASHPGAGIDANATLKALVARFGGKGGGKPELAQGGGLEGSTRDLLVAAKELLKP